MEVAHHLLQRPPLTVRYARQLPADARELKRLMLDNLGWTRAGGLAAGEFFHQRQEEVVAHWAVYKVTCDLGMDPAPFNTCSA